MGISDKIESFIMELLKEEGNGDWLELRRNELASVFNCVPSQINYVISTRFTPKQGYIVESRRGGGGYLRIRKINMENSVYKILNSIGDRLDFQSAKAYVTYLLRTEIIDDTTAKAMAAAVSDNAVKSAKPHEDKLRADILRSMLTAIE